MSNRGCRPGGQIGLLVYLTDAAKPDNAPQGNHSRNVISNSMTNRACNRLIWSGTGRQNGRLSWFPNWHFCAVRMMPTADRRYPR